MSFSHILANSYQFTYSEGQDQKICTEQILYGLWRVIFIFIKHKILETLEIVNILPYTF